MHFSACGLKNYKIMPIENLKYCRTEIQNTADCVLKIYAESFGAELFHYQDYAGREIDAVVELKDGRWCAFEIKLGANQIDKAAANLIKIKKRYY